MSRKKVKIWQKRTGGRSKTWQNCYWRPNNEKEDDGCRHIKSTARLDESNQLKTYICSAPACVAAFAMRIVMSACVWALWVNCAGPLWEPRCPASEQIVLQLCREKKKKKSLISFSAASCLFTCSCCLQGADPDVRGELPHGWKGGGDVIHLVWWRMINEEKQFFAALACHLFCTKAGDPMREASAPEFFSLSGAGGEEWIKASFAATSQTIWFLIIRSHVNTCVKNKTASEWQR